MVNRARIVIVNRLGKRRALANGNRRELGARSDIANGIDGCNIGLRIGIHRHFAACPQFHTSVFQPQSGGVGHATGGIHDKPCAGFSSIGKGRLIAIFRLRDFGNIDLRFDGDIFFHHFSMHMRAHLIIKPAQDFFAPINKRGVHAEPVEDACELHGDIAAADNGDGRR